MRKILLILFILFLAVNVQAGGVPDPYSWSGEMALLPDITEEDGDPFLPACFIYKFANAALTDNGDGSCSIAGGGGGGTECVSSACDLHVDTELNTQGICLADGTDCPAAGAGDLLADGTIPMTANFDMGGFSSDNTIGIISDTEILFSPYSSEIERLSAWGSTITGAQEVTGNANAATITEGGNAVYSSGETPSGELGGTYAAITIDDGVTVDTWVLGDSTATTINKVTITAPASAATLTIEDGFTLTADGNATVQGTNTGDNTIATTGDSATAFFGSGTLEEGLLPDSATVDSWVMGDYTFTTGNNVTVTAPAVGSTLTIQNSKTLTVTDDTTLGGGTHSGTNTGDNDEVGTKTSGDLCINDGTDVNCTVNTIAELETALDAEDIITKTEGDLAYAPIAVVDEVNTKNTGDLCINDGTNVECTVNTIAELETALDAENVLTEDEIDASSELYALTDDETGSGGGTPLLVFNYNPTLTGVLLAGIIADNDDMVFECDANSDGSNKFSWTDGAAGEILSLTEAGLITIKSAATIDINGGVLDNVVTLNLTAGGLSDDSIQADDIDTINCGTGCTWDAANDEIDVDITDEVGTLNTGDMCTNDGSDVQCTVNTEAEFETAMDAIDFVTVTADDITSANLATLVNGETGTGDPVFSTAPTFVTNLKTPAIIADGELQFTPAGVPTLLMTASGNTLTNNSTGHGLNLQQNGISANDKNAILISSNAVQVNDAHLLEIIQDNASSTSRVVQIQNDGTGDGVRIEQVGALATTKHAIYVDGTAANVAADAALVKFHQNNAGSSEPVLELVNDGTGAMIEMVAETTDIVASGEIQFTPASTDALLITASGNTSTVALTVNTGGTSGVVFGTGAEADPCGTFAEGTIFYNATSNYFCYCDGSNDLKMNDNSTACF